VESRRSRIELDEAGRRALMDEACTLVLGTVGPDGRPHLVPMWLAFGDDGRPCSPPTRAPRRFATSSATTALLEAGESYGELRGIAIDGRAELIASPEAARPARQAPKRVVIRIHPKRARSWNHHRLGAATG
jgi:nitroimidazol reductase NimA-like FMN-containing flavoprotein (pyridoxamine 5'-phosphate oxidase superfamily)